MYITVREEIDPNQAGKRIYSIELTERSRLGRHLEAVEYNPAEFPSPTIYKDNINNITNKSQ
ncbi:MAG: hypothetical protein FWE23_00035 [Chitinivibrionia bacterium]|nr:hypothetical protein [Chitinivibrionia bacterium]